MNKILKKIKQHSWIGTVFGALFLTVLVSPIFVLGKGCVFDWHDQMDETILAYIFGAKYGGGMYEPLMNGISSSGLKPSAIIFVPLYMIWDAYTAFVIQYIIVLLSAFYGMFSLIRKITDNWFVAWFTAATFSCFSFLHIYGLSVMGIPLLLSCFWNLYYNKHKKISCLGIVYFVCSTHLVLSGFVVIVFLGLFLLVDACVSRKLFQATWLGYGLLLGAYFVLNFDLVLQLVIKKSEYLSHREEFVNAGVGFWDSLRTVFGGKILHASVPIDALMITIAAGAVAGILLLVQHKRVTYLKYIGAVTVLILMNSLLYAFFSTQAVADWQNSQSGIFHYFEFSRFNWVLPALWAILFGVCLGCVYAYFQEKCEVAALIICVGLFGITFFDIIYESNFYKNVNQYNNGSEITGYITWESLYAEEVMGEVEDCIGKDKKTYRVASLGMSPVVSLMNGFYTVDGYSNNYSLDYKYSFRQIIAKEMEKAPETAVYFDTWGSRCYLFNAETGTYSWIGKDRDIKYKNLEFDVEALKNLNCEYIFSAAEVLCAEELNWKYLGDFKDDISYWHVWVYEIQ